jgi:transcriptional regulator with XRE-family HTH domain
MSKSVFTDAYRIMLEHLVAARKRAGVSQVELGKRLGRQQSVISLIESGERRLDVIEFYAIARALGCDPAELFRELVEKLPEKVGI